MPIEIEPIHHPRFDVMSYVVWDTNTKDTCLVDCGGNVDAILAVMESHSLVLEYVFHTHAFLEFLEGQPALRDEIDSIFATMSPIDEFWLAHLDTQASILNVEEGPPQAFVDQQAFHGDVFKTGPLEVRVIETPGHSPGGLCYYIPAANAVFTGDALYKGDIGATDLPHGNYDHLVNSIKTKLFVLPDDTRVFPGRGEPTTIGDEKKNNTLVSRQAYVNQPISS